MYLGRQQEQQQRQSQAALACSSQSRGNRGVGWRGSSPVVWGWAKAAVQMMICLALGGGLWAGTGGVGRARLSKAMFCCLEICLRIAGWPAYCQHQSWGCGAWG